MTTLRAALAEPTVPSDCTDSNQPVAWYHVPHPGNGISPVVSMFQQREPSLYGAVVPLYTAPPQRKPLTEEEIEKATREVWRSLPSDFDYTTSSWIEIGIKYAERAHGIGEKE